MSAQFIFHFFLLPIMVWKSCWMLLACLLFAMMAVCVKEASAFCTTFEIVFYRCFVGVLVVGAFMLFSGISPATSHPWRHLRRCCCGISAAGIQFWTITQLPLGTAQTLMSSSPLFFALYTIIAARFAYQKIEWGIVASIAFGFLGVVIIMKPDSHAIVSIAALIGLFGAFIGAWGDWFTRDLSWLQEPKERVVFWLSTFGSTAGIVSAYLFGDGFHRLGPQGWFWVCMTGLMGTLGQLAMTVAWTYGHALLNSIFQFSGILFAALFGLILFHEVPDFSSLLGMSIVLLAGACASALRIWYARSA